jgi:dTDP-4-dehydrorhamnose reductase
MTVMKTSKRSKLTAPSIKAPWGKLLIVGVDSQIGSALRDHLMKQAFEVYGTTRNQSTVNTYRYYFDLERPNYEILNNKFDLVVICAGVTNIAQCQKSPKLCRQINVTNTIDLIRKLETDNTFIIYLSSSLVFNGAKAFYGVSDSTSPIVQYGKFKVEVESYLANKKNCCVLRLTKVISPITPFIAQWEKDAKAGLQIKTFSNVYLSPVSISNVVDSIQLLMTQKQNGVFHLGGGVELSYTEYARELFRRSPKKIKLISENIAPVGQKVTPHNSLATYLPTKEVQYNELRSTERVTMGLMSGYAYLGDTKRLAFTLSRYKFVSKMLSGLGDVLEVGCADAFGTPLVLKEVNKLIACDFDSLFINDASRTHPYRKEIVFQIHDMVAEPMSMKFDAVYSLDVLEHIDPKHEHKFMSNITQSLRESGTCIIGIPSSESQMYASEVSKQGHVNCKTGAELKKFLTKYFKHTFIFCMNDEVVHTGYQPMAHYLLALCVVPIR